MASALLEYGYHLITWWTDNHMVIVDFSTTWLDGRQIQETLEKIWISSSASTIPDDPNPAYKPSGLRLGTPAMTTRGVKEEGIRQIVDFIHKAIENNWEEDILIRLKAEVLEFCRQYPLPQ
jgi:glycine hydroxymethyltransferase